MSGLNSTRLQTDNGMNEVAIMPCETHITNLHVAVTAVACAAIGPVC